MSIAQMFVGELEHELKTTRRFLERLPADKLDWKPHPKSQTAGQLALHIATIPGGIAGMSQSDEVALPDFSKPFPQPTTLQEVLAAHDASAIKAREILNGTSDARMQELWHATMAGKRVMSMPRQTMLRMIMLNHWIQHRGQLGVYLRLLGAKVPSSYGPSGDEPAGGA